MHAAFSFKISTRIQIFLKTEISLSVFEKNTRPHEVYLNCFLPTMKHVNIPYRACVKVRSIWCLTLLYSKAFAGFWPSTCKRELAFSKTSTLGTVIENLLFMVSENAVYVWTDVLAVKGRKKSPFKKYLDTCGRGLKADKCCPGGRYSLRNWFESLPTPPPPPPPPANLSLHLPHSKTSQHYEGVEAAWYFQFPWKA